MTKKLEQMIPALETAGELTDTEQVAVLAYAQGLAAAAKLTAAAKKEGESDE